MRLHHVQVACPPGGEAAARSFYVDGLGLIEEAKPVELQARGGLWVRHRDAHGSVTLELHVGVEDPFAPARKAHPALLLDSVAELDVVASRLIAGGFDVDARERRTFPGLRAAPHLRPARQPGRAARGVRDRVDTHPGVTERPVAR